MTARNLVIVRAGDQSLHPRWLEGAPARSWDLLVNYYGDDPEKFRRPDVLRIDSKGPKWPALRALIEAQQDLLCKYDYVWLPDDDLDCDAERINRLFALCRHYKLALAQPALTWDSYVSIGVTVKSPFFRLRWTNFVEAMAPCFEREILFGCLPTLSESLSGWGIEYLWTRMIEAGARRIAVIDAVSVTHTRPVGAANYFFLERQGITASEEMKRLFQRHAISDRRIRIEALVTRGGITLDRESLTARLLLCCGYVFSIALAYLLRRPNRWVLDRYLRPAITSPAEWPDL